MFLPDTIGDMFSIIGIDPCNIPLALKALEKDSQNGILGKRGAGHKPVPQEFYNILDSAMAAHGCPIRSNMTVEEYRQVMKY